MERGGVGESRRRVITRRLKTVPSVVLGLAVVTVLLPVLLVLAVLLDVCRARVLRTSFMATRLGPRGRVGRRAARAPAHRSRVGARRERRGSKRARMSLAAILVLNSIVDIF